MVQRRRLVEGVDTATDVARAVEEEFVYGHKGRHSRPKAEPAPPAPAESIDHRKTPTASVSSRIGLTTRMRADFATALKRASLERQLQGIKPNSLQDILEAALEPWLRSNGYLS
jgi:hypothetical protein